MDWSSIITSVLTTGVISSAVYFLRDRITDALFKKFQSQLDKELATLQSTLRERESRLQAELSANGKEMEQLRSSAVAALATRQSGIEKRRLEAVDQLWGAVHALGPAKAAATWMAIIKFEAFAKAAERDPRVREVVKAFDVDPATYGAAMEKANSAQPFVSPVAWAYFKAYSLIVGYAITQVVILKTGQPAKMADPEPIISMVTTVLPEYKEYLGQHGPQASFHLLDILADRLLTELQSTLDNRAHDQSHVQRLAAMFESIRTAELAVQPAS